MHTSEFQASLICTVIPCLKKKTKQEAGAEARDPDFSIFWRNCLYPDTFMNSHVGFFSFVQALSTHFVHIAGVPGKSSHLHKSQASFQPFLSSPSFSRFLEQKLLTGTHFLSILLRALRQKMLLPHSQMRS